MKKESIITGTIGLFLGAIVALLVAVAAVNTGNTRMMSVMGMKMPAVQFDAKNHKEMSMADMTKQLNDLSDEEFDQAFIEMMISHHEGGVDMAKLALNRAKHSEARQLGEEIVVAQTKEINDMKLWQVRQGYQGNEAEHMMHRN